MPTGARCVSYRTFASKFVEAPSLAMPLITERRRKPAGVEMGAAWAVFMNDAVIGELGTIEFIERGQFAHRDVLENNRQQVVRVGRTAGQIHDRLARHNRIHAHRAGGIGIRGWNSSPGGA